MRIGIDLRLHAYAPGGISQYARSLAQHVAQVCGSESLALVYHRRERELLDVVGVRQYVAWTPPHHRWERWLLGAEVLPLRLHVFHSTDFIPIAWGAHRKVITVHDLNFLHYPEYLSPSARRYYNDQIAWAVTHADAIVVDSYATRDDLVNLLSVPAARVTTIHLAAADIYRPLPDKLIAPVLQHYGLERDYLLFVGTWEPRKNLSGLLEALAILHARGQRRPLLIVGRLGWMSDDIFARVESLGLGAWVRFVERPTTEHLIAFYNGARMLVLPSYYEGFGLPALEAMQCGTPVVVANRASLPEVVGEAGLCVDPDDPAAIADACELLIADEGLHGRLRLAGLARARKFTWEATARATLAVYRSLAA